MLILFMLVLARVTGLFMGAPVLSRDDVPRRFKIVIMAALSLAILPTVDTTLMPSDGYDVIVAMIGEVAVGYFFGLMAMLIVNAFQGAGSLIAFQMGFAMARTIDPTDQTSSPIIGTVYGGMVTTAFLVMDGHHLLIQAVAASYNTFPVGGVMQTGVMAELLFSAGGTIFEMAARVAGPVTGVMLLINSLIGFLNRVIPQLSIFNIGLPITVFSGLTAVGFALPGAMNQFLKMFGALEEQIVLMVAR